MKEYICCNCNYEFNHDKEKSKSILVKILDAQCPNCKSFNIDLSPNYKLRLVRKIKIKKINNL